MHRLLHSAAASTLRMCARKLPWGGQRVLLNTLVERFGTYATLSEIGSRLRIQSVTIRGRNGAITGPLHDLGLFARYAAEGEWSLPAIEQLSSLLKEAGGGSYLDIGANIGLTLIPIAQVPNVRCYAFEPHPGNFGFLSHNVQANCPQADVRVHQLALFHEKGVLEMSESEDNSGDHQLIAPGMGATREGRIVRVSVERLDDVVAVTDLPKPLVVKIDTQGAEPGVFQGGARVLASAALIQLEFWPAGIRRLGGDARPMLAFLETHFDEGAIASGDSAEPPEWMSMGNLAKRLADHWDSPVTGSNYFDVVVRKTHARVA